MNKFKNIILIDLKKYNDVFLSKVSNFLNIKDGDLQSDKKSGFTLVWLDLSESVVENIAYKLDKNFDVSNTYKGLISISNNLTKKEKDFLLKMKPFNFLKTKKVVTIINNIIEVVNEDIILDVDTILDKISKNGVKSLLKEEKDFLDNFYK